MKKILLIVEDYHDLTTTEVYLKKIGFDVVGISNELLMSEQLVSFNPDIVVANGKGQRVNSMSVGAKLKDNRKFNGKVLLVFQQGFRPNPQEMIKLRMDAALENPIDPFKMIQTLARLGKLDTNLLIEKLKKATLIDPHLKQKLNVSGGQSHENDTHWVRDDERVKGYQKYIKGIELDLSTTTFQKSEVRNRQNELKKDWNFDELEELDKLKREFAAALFKK